MSDNGDEGKTYTCDLCEYVSVGDSNVMKQMDLIRHVKQEHPIKRIFKLHADQVSKTRG